MEFYSRKKKQVNVLVLVTLIGLEMSVTVSQRLAMYSC